MRTLIVSDVHSNIVALDAVFEDAESDEPIDNVLCLGDVVGYGPAPMQCLDRLRERHALLICGNHDAAAAGTVGTEEFNAYAAQAIKWTKGHLSQEAIDYLAQLPQTLSYESFLMVHGSPKDPIWEYLVTYGQATDAWERTNLSDLLCGHSHIQFVITAGQGIEQASESNGGALTVPLGLARVVINPGSVGQPRDRDPRAAYAVYDDESNIVTLRRVWYDISATQRQMAEAGLPEPLISRLSMGR